jgi:hypothetical protein
MKTYSNLIKHNAMKTYSNLIKQNAMKTNWDSEDVAVGLLNLSTRYCIQMHSSRYPFEPTRDGTGKHLILTCNF